MQVAFWTRAASRSWGPLLGLAGQQLSPSETLEKVLPGSPALLIQLSRQRCQGGEHAEIRHLLAQRAEHLFGHTDLPDGKRYFRLRDTGGS